MSTRYKLIIEYDGTDFVGWQRQLDKPSVQKYLEDAIFDAFGERAQCCAAGRTDAGVHAYGQVVHFDLENQRRIREIFGALNFRLRQYRICIIDANIVDKSFSARFSAQQRRYIYRISNRRSPLAIDFMRAWHVDQKLDVERMNDAAQSFVGKNDLSSFRSYQCQSKNAVRTIDYIRVWQPDLEAFGSKSDIILVDIAARSFLHNQVRIIVGTLKDVGLLKKSKVDVQRALTSNDRSLAGQTAPPHGLYFHSAIYN